MGVVGTLTALVLGLLVASANSSYNASNQEVTSIAANVIQLDRTLRRYGPEADGVRNQLRLYTITKLEDLFPEGSATPPRLDNPTTVRLFEELQDRLAAMEGHSAHQRWLLSQALQLTIAVVGSRWLLVEREMFGIAVPLLVCRVLAMRSFHEFRPIRTPITRPSLWCCSFARLQLQGQSK